MIIDVTLEIEISKFQSDVELDFQSTSSDMTHRSMAIWLN